MGRVTRHAPSIVRTDQRADALALIATIVDQFASEAPLPEAVASILDALRDGLALDACAVWSAADPEEPLGMTGDGTLDAARLPAPYGHARRPPRGVAWLRLETDRARPAVGLLALAHASALSSRDRLVLSAAGRLVANLLVAAERSRRVARDEASRLQEIDEQRRFIGRIVDSLPVGLYVVDREYRVQAWNRKRETGLQGVLREEALGRTIFEILRRQPADLLRREFDEVFRDGVMTQFEMESSASGEPRTFRVSKIPMRINDAEVTHVITIGEDITDWKRAEARVAETQRLAALGQLSAGVMHEINNPLATIAACAESLSLHLQDQDPLPPALHDAFAEYTRIIEHEVHRSKRIVDGLLDFSRPRVEEKAVVDPNAVVEQTLFLLKHHGRFKQMRVALELDRVPAPVRANAEQLVQVLMALLLNAADAMPPGGQVTVRTYVLPGAGDGAGDAVIEVRDEGHGISASALGKVFEPFYTTKSPGRGTGLGLSIGYGIVADHGGRIEVDSVVGRGSTFRVRLPIERAA